MKNNNEKLGVFACVTALIGGMVGSAIFSLSGQTMVQAGPGAVITWVLAGLIMLFYGFCCAELAGRYPFSGGLYLFPAKAFNNNYIGWISNWGSTLANIVAIAFSAIYVSIYLGVGFSLSASFQVPLAIASILFCLLLNLSTNTVFGKLNSILVIGLILTMLVFIITAFSFGSWNTENMKPFLTQGTLGKIGFLRAVPVAMLGYGNIVSMSFLVSKTRNPQKTLPKAVCIAMFFVISIYTLMVVATLGLIRVSYLQENPGLSFIPIYAACFTALAKYSWITKIVSVSAVLSLLTTMLILMLVTANGLSASADDRILPSVFKKRNKSGEPAIGMVIVTVVCIIISCFPSFTSSLVNYGALFSVVTIILNVLSVMKSRKTKDFSCIQEKGFKAPFGVVMPVMLICVILFCYVSDITSGWQIWAYSLLCYAVGSVIYMFSLYSLSGKKK